MVSAFFIKLLRNQGLAAARSRSRSDSPPDCHSFRSRRYATLIARDIKSEVYPRADCLWVKFKIPFVIFVQKFLKGVWGKLLARSFPHKTIIQ